MIRHFAMKDHASNHVLRMSRVRRMAFSVLTSWGQLDFANNANHGHGATTFKHPSIAPTTID
jgi:hypothetical protein